MQSPTHRLPTLTALLVLSATTLLAQGGGPLQPEFTGSPVPAGPNVNEFTGDFTYGLPVMTVPGPYGSSYTISLSYRAGTNPNAEVGWVGYGWSLNPGSIVREKRGFPDDWDGTVVYHNKAPLNYTVSATYSIGAEFASLDKGGDGLLSKLGLSAGGSATQRYDNLTGYAKIWGIHGGASFVGNYAGLNYMNENGEGQLTEVLSPNLWMTGAELLGHNGGTKENKQENTWVNSAKRTTNKLLSNGGTQNLNLITDRELNMDPPSVVGIHGNSANYGSKFGLSASQGAFSGADIGASGNVTEYWSIPNKTLTAYGLMRSAQGLANPSGLMDYYYENDLPFSLKDRFLPIPFANADQFTVSNGGAFRLFNRGILEFQQNSTSSIIDIDNLEVKIIGGTAWGVGARWGDGSIEYLAGPWRDDSISARHTVKENGDEPWFFRFSNDLGGSLLYDSNDDAVRSGIRNDTTGVFPRIHSSLGLRLEEWERPGRNSYIGFTRHGDMLAEKNSKYLKSYTKDAAVRDLVYDRENMTEQIGEFALYGTGNNRYVYGLPVYARNERNLSLGLRNITLDSAANLRHNFLAYRWLDETTAPTVIGQDFPEPYATAWLLTEITSPDYIDLSEDGPTEDDLGSWTKFHYQQASYTPSKTGGLSSTWDYWRNPYSGLAYDAGTLSDPLDDLGRYAEGRRENYYLSSIETKTHIALFRLNEFWENPRKDAYVQDFTETDARRAGDSSLTVASYDVSDNPAPNPFRRYLDRIELYNKNAAGEPDSLLATVYFEYDYSLRPNMPNSLPVHPDSTTRYGMLTLRKVWTEHHGVKNARIAPIIFGYDYRTGEDYSTAMRDRYPEITSFADSLTADMQNPSYSPYDFDPWGNYRPGGAGRLDRRFPFIPQNDTSTWDPAAWQLKWVRQPAGGEMHIQYEEDEYAFVHDRPVMAMVSMIEQAGSEFEKSYDHATYNKYYLRLSDIGLDSTDYTSVAKVRELLLDQQRRSAKLFFRFLYALKGDSAQLEDPEYQSEYIEGYADLDEVDIDVINEGMPDEWYALYVKLIGRKEGGSAHDDGLPKTVCLDYVHKRKRGKLSPGDGIPYRSGTFRAVEMIWDMLGFPAPSFNDGNHCKDLDYANSTIRIPMITPKKGGGLRVKRLLAYDPAIEGDSALYGTEYHYEKFDPERNEVMSSGVAANEPAAMRNENPLVTCVIRVDDDELKGKAMAFQNRSKNEGPLGETLLPGASVGYSRVAAHSIHQGVTATGFSVTDFFTYRDYPIDGWYQGIGRGVSATTIKDDPYRTPFPLENLIVFQKFEIESRMTQGYRFILHDMHGRTRRQLTNGGRYTPYERNWLTSGSVENVYYEPGDSVPLLYRFGDTIRYGRPGKQMEVIHASRHNASNIKDLKIEGDAGFWFLSGFGYYAVNNSELFTNVTTKISTYPALVKGVLSFVDGNYNYKENVAFDPRTGRANLTRSRDAFDGMALHQASTGHVGTYHNYTVPLVNRLPEIGLVAENERAFLDTAGGLAVIKGSDGNGPFLDFPGGSETRWLKKLTQGDLVELTVVSSLEDAGRYHVDHIDGTVARLIPSFNFNAPSGDDSIALTRTGQVFVEVIRSGRENDPAQSLGIVSTYGETSSEVELGQNIAWAGGDGPSRLAVVDTLNAMLAAGSGTISSSNVDPTLKVRHYTTGSCLTVGTLGETWDLSVSGDGDTVFIAMTSYADTLLNQGAGGWFDLDDAGQIVYRSIGNLTTTDEDRTNPVEQRVLNFTFCGDDPPHRTVEHVISGVAGIINDTVDWNSGGVASSPGERNAFESGERGRWSPRTTYVYRTSVTGSSQPVAGERIYKDAGVYDDFSLFNWTEPWTSDAEHWIRLDSTTHINKHNIPYGAVDLLGLSRTTVYDYGQERNLIPILSAWNAEVGTVDFQSFEAFDVAEISGINDLRGHAGEKSLVVDGGDTSVYGVEVTINDHLLEKGGFLSWWSTHDGDDIRIVLTTGSAPVVPVRIARAGEWVLYEVTLSADTLDYYYDPESLAHLRFSNTGGDSIWVDDIRFQPTDARVATSVVHPQTYHFIAAFDDEHFGIYPISDRQGSHFGLEVETFRGLRSVGDAHVHLAGTPRDWLGEGSPFTGTEWSGGGLPTSILNGNGDQSDNRASFELLDLHIGLSEREVKTFGVDPGELRSLVTEKYQRLTEGQERLLADFDQLSTMRDQLLQEMTAATSEAERESIRKELERVRKEQNRMLEQLGIDPETLEGED